MSVCRSRAAYAKGVIRDSNPARSIEPGVVSYVFMSGHKYISRMRPIRQGLPGIHFFLKVLNYRIYCRITREYVGKA